MKRYESLTNLSMALEEDSDVVLVNVSDDLGDKVPEHELMDYITLAVGWQF